MVVFALGAVALVGVMALGADVGVLYYNWVQLQKAADAAALAGASYLPNDTTTATATAQTYATNNGVLPSDTITATPINGNSQMQVTLQRTVPYSFARVLGLTDGYVKVLAIASVPPAATTVNAGPGDTISCNGSACTSGGRHRHRGKRLERQRHAISRFMRLDHRPVQRYADRAGQSDDLAQRRHYSAQSGGCER